MRLSMATNPSAMLGTAAAIRTPAGMSVLVIEEAMAEHVDCRFIERADVTTDQHKQEGRRPGASPIDQRGNHKGRHHHREDHGDDRLRRAWGGHLPGWLCDREY
jgi:hypothetical protein